MAGRHRPPVWTQRRLPQRLVTKSPLSAFSRAAHHPWLETVAVPGGLYLVGLGSERCAIGPQGRWHGQRDGTRRHLRLLAGRRRDSPLGVRADEHVDFARQGMGRKATVAWLRLPSQPGAGALRARNLGSATNYERGSS